MICTTTCHDDEIPTVKSSAVRINMPLIIALAVISRQGSPIYLHDYISTSTTSRYIHHHNDIDDILLFGDDDDEIDGHHEQQLITSRTSSSVKQRQEWPCRLEYQFILHSACERLHELLEENMGKTPSSGGDSMGIMEACWAGYLCSSDNLKSYGYVTTNIRYIILVEDAMQNAQGPKSSDSELCVLMSNIHRLYTESLLNPFTSIESSKITSKKFDSRVLGLVQQYNDRMI